MLQFLGQTCSRVLRLPRKTPAGAPQLARAAQGNARLLLTDDPLKKGKLATKCLQSG